MEKYTLYQLLNGCKDPNGNQIKGVTVPLIQREYAQGRLGKEELRQNILNQMKECINSNQTTDAPTLDFVYGRLKNEIFYPLDGQQRLTTLWLLHWYISFKAGTLNNDKEWLIRFSYQTRTTSEEFCKTLCDEMGDVDPNDMKIKRYRTLSDYIKEQNWFYSIWLQDPTIVSMLRTLSGDVNESDERKDDYKSLRIILDEKGKNNITECFPADSIVTEKDLCSWPTLFLYFQNQDWFDDSWLDDPVFSTEIRQMGNDNIESIFGMRNDYLSLMDALKGSDSRLSFAVVFFDDNKLKEETGDDIYIKMNSTGKRLTDFENFKADWIAHLQEVCPDKYSRFAGYIDNLWTDVFWQYIKGIKKDKFDGEIDIQYFQFINRFFLNRIVTGTSVEGSPNYVSASVFKTGSVNKIKKYSAISSFQQLYGKDQGQQVDDTKIEYNGFSSYHDYCDESLMEDLNTVFRFLTNNEKIVERLCINSSPENEWTFLPGFNLICDKEKKTETLEGKSTSQPERVYFHAVSQYIILSKKIGNIDSNCKVVDEDDFVKKYNWLIHIVRNLIINGEISTIDNMVAAIRKIDGIVNGMSAHKMDVYEYLSSLYVPPFVDKKESKLDMQYREEIEKAKYLIGTDMDRRKEVIKAEKLPFCVGSIRFLYKGIDGKKVGVNVWELFTKKSANAENWFMDTPNDKKVSEKVIKEFLKYFDDYSVVKGKGLLTNRYNDWKDNILTNPDYADKVHKLLSTDPQTPSSQSPFPSERIIDAVLDLSDDNRCYDFTDINGLSSLHKVGTWYDYLIFGEGRKAKCEALQRMVNKKIVTVDNNLSVLMIDGYYYGNKIWITENANARVFLWKVIRGKDYLAKKDDNKEEKDWEQKVWDKADDLETILVNLSR